MTGVKAVNVTLTSMSLFAAAADSGEGRPLVVSGATPATGLTLNLLDYQSGKTALAAVGDVPAGAYQKIRMNIAAASLARDDDGNPATPDKVDPIFVPSGKVDVPVSFTVSPGAATDVTLDFNAQLSVQVNSTPVQGYILRPVITPVRATRP